MQNWFTSLPGHDYFCEVHEDFIEDDFNLTGQCRCSCPSRRLHFFDLILYRLTSHGPVLERSPGDGARRRARYAECTCFHQLSY